MKVRMIVAVAAVVTAGSFTAPTAGASVTDTPARICGELRTGAALTELEAKMLAAGYTEHNAGAATGAAVRDRCPEQTTNVLRQLKEAGYE